MKKAGIGCLVIVVILAVIVGVALFATSDLPKAADALFSLVAQGRVDEAYQSTAAEFRAATSAEDFASFLESTALAGYQSASWTSRSVKNNTGELEGTITTKDGGQIPVTIDLVKEGGDWKILALRKAGAGLITPTAEPDLPPDAEVQRLTAEAMAQLDTALRGNDFTGFHQGISKLWQEQITPAELQTIFATFVERGIDLSPLAAETPVFSQKPFVNEDGVLTLEGYYTVQPGPVYFRLKYIYEHPQWKMLGINVSIP